MNEYYESHYENFSFEHIQFIRTRQAVDNNKVVKDMKRLK